MSKQAITLRRDPVIEVYKKDVDRTLLRESLKLTVEQRLRALMRLQQAALELRRAGRDVKRAAGRPKDFEAIAELEALLEETDED